MINSPLLFTEGCAVGLGVVNTRRNTCFHDVKGLHYKNQGIAVYGISADFVYAISADFQAPQRMGIHFLFQLSL